MEKTGRKWVYFVADVHLGLKTSDPVEREARFVRFLKDIPRDTTKSLYLLGDIWDFWYEYRDVVPREGARVVSELIQLMDAGVEVYFIEGNHDMWTFSFFENLGMKKLPQPFVVELGGKKFCLGHGDGLGGAGLGYRIMLSVFHSKVARALFSTLHPWLAYRFGLGWSNSNRRTHEPYTFRNEEEPLYRFAVGKASKEHIDCFVFGHFHDRVCLTLPGGEKFFVLKDWMEGGTPCLCYDIDSGEFRF